MEPEDKELTKEWIVGFFEAEGGFFISGGKSHPPGKGGVPCFCIAQNEKEILEKIKEKLPAKLSLTFDKRGGWLLRTGSTNEIEKLIEYFDGALQSEKKIKQLEEVKAWLIARGRANVCWAESEDKVVKENWLKIPTREITKLLPGRTEEAIQQRARILNLEHVWWTKEEDEFIIKNFTRMTAPEMAKKLERTVNAVYARARLKLGLRLCGRKWSEREIKILRENWLKIKTKELAKTLPSRTVHAIRTRARILKLRTNRWTKEEDNFIRNNLRMSAKQIAKELGRTPNAIHTRICNLGLRKKTRF